SFASTSFTRTSSLSARSFTVMPSASVIVRVIGGGAAGTAAMAGAAGRSLLGATGRAPGGGICGIGGRGAGGRTPGIPGRACALGCVRTGCEGSGRGPPNMLGVVGRGGGGYAGRGTPAGPGRPEGVEGRAAAGGVAAAFDGVAAGGCTMRGCDTRGRLAGVSGRAGCGGLPGSSMRSPILGG